jgi:hypothetical protein
MRAVARESVTVLLPYLMAQPRTPELVALVRNLIAIDHEYTKLIDICLPPPRTLPPATETA